MRTINSTRLKATYWMQLFLVDFAELFFSKANANLQLTGVDN